MHATAYRILGRALLSLLCVPLLVLPPARAQSDNDRAQVTDAAVENAIRSAVNWLKAKRGAAGHWETTDAGASREWAGTSALVLLSLLYAGEDPRTDEMNRSLEWLSVQTMNGVYSRGTRAHALALVPGRAFRGALQTDLDWLLKAVWPAASDHPGCYDYEPHEGEKQGRWDNSVTQYGILGVWMAAEAGLSVPDAYWEMVGKHWITWQNDDGGWGYQNHEGSTGSMTAAGLASLFVVLDQRYADRPQDAPGLVGAIERGLDWFGREYGPTNPRGSSDWHYYYLYGVERVGRASGRKYFREKDWFRSGAAWLLNEQTPEGYWRGSGDAGILHNTAWALMFLCHGRAPLLCNKLQHGADWDRKLRDAAGLTRYAGHAFERLLNWQIVRLDNSIEDLLEAPLLYMRGESRWTFNDVDVQRIRDYCRGGGMVLAAVGGESEEFQRSIENLAERAFPEFPLRPVTSEHPLFSGAVQFAIDAPPSMFEVHNGLRTLLLLSTKDLANAWNKYAVRGPTEKDFQIGANIYLYATDKTSIRSRLETPTIVRRERPTPRSIRLARIRYNGPWDPEPYGWTRLWSYMHNETGTKVLVSSGVTLDSDQLGDFQVAFMTGTQAFELSEDEVRGLRKFLSRGGTLLADAAGGSRDFVRSLEQYVQQATREQPQSLPSDSYILTGAGIEDAVDLKAATYRRAARSAARGQERPRLMAFRSGRRYAVIYAPLDLTTGLLGTHVYDVQGYDPQGALLIMRNLLLYAGLSPTEKARLERRE